MTKNNWVPKPDKRALLEAATTSNLAESPVLLNERLLFIAEAAGRRFSASRTMSEPTPLRCVIVEKNEMNRLTLAHFVELTPGLILADSLPDGLAALHYLQSYPPADLLLPDIEMPYLTGLELIRVLPRPLPAIALVTSH